MKDTIWIKKGRFTPLAVVLMFAFPLVTALICLCFGRMNVPVGEVLTALRTALTGESTSNVQNYSIVINLRLPRILTAIIVGAGLSCAGNTYQSLFSNPLATPDILGVTSGTCVGAIFAIILSCSILETQLIALAFGLISVCFTLKVAGKSDGRSMAYLVLAGTIASSLFNALGSLLKYTADPQDKLPEITYWLMGSFTSASYQKILIGCPLIVAGIIIIYLLRWRLNILSLSDDEARASGINIKQTRMKNNVPFTLSQVRPIRDAMTVSRPSGLGYGVPITWFSLGAGTSITPEYYDCTTLYLGGEGNGKFLLGVDGQEVSVKPGEVLYVPPKTLCGTKTDSGMIYTEIILKKENFTMNNIIKAGQPTELKNLISYEEGSIANLDIAHADNMKFVLMAFDEGTGLTPHRAPGNAILTALEGKAIIGYEGKDYELNAGESFRFDKNGLHSVTAQGKFKMSLLLVIE